MNSAYNKTLVEHPPKTNDEPNIDFINNNIDDVMSSIIMDYLAGEDKEKGIQSEEAILMTLLSDNEKEEATASYAWNPKLRFFDRLQSRARVLKKATAKAFIAGNVEAGLALVRRTPWLIREEMEGTVFMGERSITLKGTPLQILARLGDFNPVELEEKAEPIGGVEQLIALGLLSDDEIENQLKAVFLRDWNSENRMNPLKAAVETLVKDITALDVDSNAYWDEMHPLAEEIIQRFRTTIFNLPVPETGFIFDRRIFSWFINRFWGDDRKKGWVRGLGGHAWGTKSALLFVAGLGSLQAADSACGLQIHRKGVYQVVVEKEAPNRKVHFSSGAPDFYSGLGSSFFIWVYGEDAAGGSREEAIARTSSRGSSVCFKKYCQASTASLQKLMRTPVQTHHWSRCVIL